LIGDRLGKGCDALARARWAGACRPGVAKAERLVTAGRRGAFAVEALNDSE
jgi:hypothetical protein